MKFADVRFLLRFDWFLAVSSAHSFETTRRESMGARSEAALARRAAKRGRTVEEERLAERKKEKERAKAKERPPPSDPPHDDAAPQPKRIAVGVDMWKARGMEAARGSGGLKRDEKAGWLCTAAVAPSGRRCGFINFAHRAECRECGAVRLAPPAAEEKEARGREAGGKTRRQERVSDPSRAWAGTAEVAASRLEENQKLREQLRVEPSLLSEEQRRRAEVLVERDARKRARKAAIKKEKLHAQQQRAARRMTVGAEGAAK
ncbi:hypothetical protein AB1Y20_018571 [Prymnesium parvum]|uniref:RanBP2-type domain-containing protein n=1 Tax=Prymnesium parvum TaxID=97485 RepID=A0AB34JP32_PRYPA